MQNRKKKKMAKRKRK